MNIKIFFIVAAIFLLKPLSAFAQNVEISLGDSSAKSFKPFVVYKDRGVSGHFTPSGYMPTGECLNMDEGYAQNCHEGTTCIKVTYDISCSLKGRRWAGVYWLNPPDNWGERKGGFNLTGAKKLVFWARGEKGGEQIAEFKIGGVGSNREFPDSDTATIGPVILSKDWREYTIDLRDKDLSYISGGFAWIAASDSNVDPCIFYIDDIHYE